MQNQNNTETNVEHKLQPLIKPTRGGHGRNLPKWRTSEDYTDAVAGPQRRVKPRAVDIKRALRATKKAGGTTK